MSSSRSATLCLGVDESFSGRLEDVVCRLLHGTPWASANLRFGIAGLTEAFHRLMGALCPDGKTPVRQDLPGGVERFRWSGDGGRAISCWVGPATLKPESIRRLLLFDLPVATDYVVLLSGNLPPTEPAWWAPLAQWMEQGVDYIGVPAWQEYLPAQMETIQTQRWYLGVPFERRNGRPGVSYMVDGVTAIRAERLHEANIPQVCNDVTLGEIARQMGWSRGVQG